MDEWIPFEEGEYRIERAYLAAPDHSAMIVENGVLRIYVGRDLKKYLTGDGLVQNFLLVELLDISNDLDLLIDMGKGYCFLIRCPHLKAGKVFSPNVKSMLQFTPNHPWKPLSPEEFEDIVTQLKILSF